MWLGEKITEHGIGNGISLIIFINIIGARAERRSARPSESLQGGSNWLVFLVIAGRAWWP